MINYREYLIKEKYSASSIESYLYESDKFIEWLKIKQYDTIHFDYQNALDYASYLQKKYSNLKTINHKIVGVRRYFDYLIETGTRSINPFTDMLIKGDKKKKLLHNLLSMDELEDLYYSYSTNHTTGRIDRSSDMKRLQTEHIQLSKGKIYIPGSRIGGRRELELKPWQVMELMEYLTQIRPQLLQRRNMVSDELFIVSNGRLTDTVSHLLKKLKKINYKVQNAHQLRSSVIVCWLTKYNLREVQVMAGHRRISTTERYLQEDLKALQELINTYHPLQ